MEVGDEVEIASPSRWPDGTTLYVEGRVLELRSGGKVVVVADVYGNRHYAQRRLVSLAEVKEEEG